MNTTNPLQLIPYRARRAVLLTSIVIGTASPYILTGLNGWAATALSTLMAITALFSNTQSLSNLTPDSMNQAIQEARSGVRVGGGIAVRSVTCTAEPDSETTIVDT